MHHLWVFCFIQLLTHEGSHREVYRDFQPSYDIFRRSGAKGCSDHRFRAPPAGYTAQLLALHQHRANNRMRLLYAFYIQFDLAVDKHMRNTAMQRQLIMVAHLHFFSFDTAPSFEARETHRCLNNRHGIVRARGGGFLGHPCAPCHPLSAPPTEEHPAGRLTNYCSLMSNYDLCILLHDYCIVCHMSSVNELEGVV